MRRVGDALAELSRRVGFRIIPGLGERVIYRELFPKGLTLLDLNEIGDVGVSPHRRAPGIARDDRRLRSARAGRRRRRAAPGGDGGLIGKILLGARAGGPRLSVVAAARGAGRRRCGRPRRAPCSASSRRQPRGDPRRAPAADRQGPSRRRRLGRACDPGQCGARRADRRAEAPHFLNGAELSHIFHPTSLREYDIRGIVGKTLGPADAYAIGRSFGTLVRRGGGAQGRGRPRRAGKLAGARRRRWCAA